MALDRIGLELESVELLEPGTLVGGEYAVRPALPGQHLIPVEQRLILIFAENDALRAQGIGHSPVARDGLGLIVAIRQHFPDTERLGQLNDAGRRRTVAHDESAAGRPAARRQAPQGLVEFQHAGMNELHASIMPAGQRVKNLGIEHEHAIDASILAQRMIKRGMVVTAQVPPEPDERTGKISGIGQVFHLAESILRSQRIRRPITGNFSYSSSAASQ